MARLAVWLTVANLACAQPGTPAPLTDATLRIAGADSMNDVLLPALMEAYARTESVRFVLAEGGSAQGYKALLSGKADLAAAAREPWTSEQEQATANGSTFVRHLVGVNVISVQAHASNPLGSLTYSQVRAVFCTGAITDWSQLGLEDRPIHAVVRSDKSGGSEMFEDFFCGPEGLHASHQVSDAAGIRQALQDTPGALTFAPLAESAGKPLSLRAYDGARAIPPSQANAIRGSYPLTHDLAFYTMGPPDAPTGTFLEWLGSANGQDTVDEAHVVPLYLRPARSVGARPLRETVHFEAEGTQPDQRSIARLHMLEEELRDRGGEINHVIIEGYGDPTEPDAVSRSQARAEAVRQRLVAKVPSLFFEIIPRGSTNPIAPNDTPKGQLMNRRVQIYIAEEEQIPAQDDDASVSQ